MTHYSLLKRGGDLAEVSLPADLTHRSNSIYMNFDSRVWRQSNGNSFSGANVDLTKDIQPRVVLKEILLKRTSQKCAVSQPKHGELGEF